jgi:hypothetical protein
MKKAMDMEMDASPPFVCIPEALFLAVAVTVTVGPLTVWFSVVITVDPGTVVVIIVGPDGEMVDVNSSDELDPLSELAGTLVAMLVFVFVFVLVLILVLVLVFVFVFDFVSEFVFVFLFVAVVVLVLAPVVKLTEGTPLPPKLHKLL